MGHPVGDNPRRTCLRSSIPASGPGLCCEEGIVVGQCRPWPSYRGRASAPFASPQPRYQQRPLCPERRYTRCRGTP